MRENSHGISFDGYTLTVRCSERDWERMLHPKLDAMNALYDVASQIKWCAKFRLYYADIWFCDGLICRKNKKLLDYLIIDGTLRKAEADAEPIYPAYARGLGWVFFALIDGVYKKLSYGINPSDFIDEAFCYFRPLKKLPLLR